MSPVVFILIAGAAVGRATRLIVNDSILDGPRAKLHSWLPETTVELISCPWCISGWLALSTVIWMTWAHWLAMPFLSWLAVWWIANCTYWLTEYLAARAQPEDNPAADFWAKRK